MRAPMATPVCMPACKSCNILCFIQDILKIIASNKDLQKNLGDLYTKLKTEADNVRRDVGDVRRDVGDVRRDVGDVRRDVGDVRGMSFLYLNL